MALFNEWVSDLLEEARKRQRKKSPPPWEKKGDDGDGGKKGTLPPPKDTAFWTDKFGEGEVDDASVEDLYKHAKTNKKGLLSAIRSLQLIANYGSFPKKKMKEMWAKYKKDGKKNKK